MKPYLPILIICAGSAFMPAGAQARTMTVTTGSSGAENLEVTVESRITFSKDLSTMIVSAEGSDATRSFNIDDIVNIIFTMDASVDRNLKSDGLTIANSGGIVTVSGADIIEYAVWDASGNPMATGHGEHTVTLDFTSRTPGIYIIKVNDRTIKFINR